MWSGIGGKGKALNARDVGEVGDNVGDDDAEDVWESMAGCVVCLLCLDVANGVRLQDFAETGTYVRLNCRCRCVSRSYLVQMVPRHWSSDRCFGELGFSSWWKPVRVQWAFLALKLPPSASFVS
jgi:hypothetical protein